MRTFFWYSIISKNCADYTFIRFYFIFYNFSLNIGSLSNLFLILLLSLSHILLYFSSNSSCFIKKDIHLALLKLFVYTRNFGDILQNGLNILLSLLKSCWISIFYQYLLDLWKLGFCGSEICVFQYQYYKTI